MVILADRLARSEVVYPQGGAEEAPHSIVYRDGPFALISEVPILADVRTRRDKMALLRLLPDVPESLSRRFVPTRFVGEHEGRPVYEQPYLSTWGAVEGEPRESSFERLQARIAGELIHDSEYLTVYSFVAAWAKTFNNNQREMEVWPDLPDSEYLHISHKDVLQWPNGDWCLNDPVGCFLR